MEKTINKFFTADWHLGETRLELAGRPFKTPEEHVETIVANHNKMVKPDDIVYVVGDVLYQGTHDPHRWLQYVGVMNGRKILIRGNHDRPFNDDLFAPYFTNIVEDGGGIELVVSQGEEMSLATWVTHYPTQGRADRFNIVGHIHGIWKVQLNMLNVGVDVHHFYPVPEHKILFYHDAICKYYDEDAWVGYNPVNASYREERGKKSTYFGG